MDPQASTRAFVLDFLREIGAQVSEADGVYTVVFPAGRKRAFGRERRFTFEPERRQEQVELVEVGSPLLKALLLEAKKWGRLGTVASTRLPPGTRVYTFQFDAYSSLKKRTQFAWVTLGADASVQARAGIPEFFESPESDLESADADDGAHLRDGLDSVLPAAEQAGRAFSRDAVKESDESFHKAMSRVSEYYQGMKHETFLEEARIRRRLGEIQSKLYFTEDGIRERKLQQEQERLTQELHALKKRNTQAGQALQADRQAQADKQRRLHEPKLRIRLVAATLVRAPPPAPAVQRQLEQVPEAASGGQ